MAFYRGEEGSVKFDDAGSSASAITSTRSWSLTLDKEVLETTVMGDTYAGNVGGIISGNGSVEVIYTASSSDETAAFIDHINTATAEEIAESLSGIGLSKAERIVEYREANGDFKHVDELVNVKGLGIRTVDKNRDLILLTSAKPN